MKPQTRQRATTEALRPPSQVMRLQRIGSFHQTRLSFLRNLMRRAQRQNWVFQRPVWQVDNDGVGHAIYTVRGPLRTYSLVAFSHKLDPTMRSDRVIAQAWDATFALFDGEPSAQDIAHLSGQVPKQEAGRVRGSELTLSRANRSVRLFEYVRDQLAAGNQPDATELDSVGYLMRTTAVYGSGKFGALDRRFIAGREEFEAPFQAELLTVYLIRTFTVDIVEHLARCKSPGTAVALAPALRRRLGVGNSTGLGMAPFIVNHPSLLHRWIFARETALARVRSVHAGDTGKIGSFMHYLARQQLGLTHWHTDHDTQRVRINELQSDLAQLHAWLQTFDWNNTPKPWDAIYRWGESNLGYEAQECLVGLLIEPHGDLVDDLTETMSVDEEAVFAVDGTMRISELQAILQARYPFATHTDFADPAQCARFWYVSEAKLEPRLGERHKEPGANLEHPLASARDIAILADLSTHFAPDAPVAELLLKHPNVRHAVRRAQIAATHLYSEIHGNLIADTMVPLDLLRCKLSFFGANRFDPRSDRWIRITLFQHAPFPNELHNDVPGDDWIYPPLDTV